MGDERFEGAPVVRGVDAEGRRGLVDTPVERRGTSAVEGMRERERRVDPLHAVRLEVEVGECGRRDTEGLHRGADVVHVPGFGELRGAQPAADRGAGLEQGDAPPGTRQGDRRHETVGTRAHDDGVVVPRSRRAPPGVRELRPRVGHRRRLDACRSGSWSPRTTTSSARASSGCSGSRPTSRWSRPARTSTSCIATVDAEPPDVVLTDIRMPPTGTDEGVRAANLLRATHPERRRRGAQPVRRARVRARAARARLRRPGLPAEGARVRRRPAARARSTRSRAAGR